MPKKAFFSPRLILIGALVGIANIIPGVSGGTIAFIFNVYQELLEALKQFNLTNLKLFFKLKLSTLKNKLPLFFLLNFFGGIILGALTVAQILKICFQLYPQHTWAFFFGLIVASIFYLIKNLSKMTFKNLFFLLIGFSCAYLLSQSTPLLENSNPLYLILCGALAVSSMIVPGLSGSYILILLGNYPLALNALSQLNLSILAPILLGCCLGFMLFVRLISWLFDHFKEQSTSTIIGFVAGSLFIIWPWKNYIYLSDPETQQLILRKEEPIVVQHLNYLPELTSHSLSAYALIVLGFVFLLALQKYLSKLKS